MATEKAVKKVATRDAYGQALLELGAENEAIVVLDADLAKSTKTALFAERFPERFFNMGIAEQNLMCTAGGLSLVGKIPFASTFAIFATGRAWEQVRNTICYPSLNVKIAATHAGVTVGEDGGSHQTVEDIGIMRIIPNMTVLVPADATETKAIVRAAVEHDGPVYIRLGRSAVPVLFEENDYEFAIGKANVIRPGSDVAICAIGTMVAAALQAAEQLAEEGIEARVINMASVKPIDRETLVAAAEECGAIVTSEEHNVIGGLGDAVTEVVAASCPVPVLRHGIEDHFGESGKGEQLLDEFGLNADGIIAKVRQALALKRNPS